MRVLDVCWMYIVPGIVFLLLRLHVALTGLFLNRCEAGEQLTSGGVTV